jgi:hypothetical protein
MSYRTFFPRLTMVVKLTVGVATLLAVASCAVIDSLVEPRADDAEESMPDERPSDEEPPATGRLDPGRADEPEVESPDSEEPKSDERDTAPPQRNDRQPEQPQGREDRAEPESIEWRPLASGQNSAARVPLVRVIRGPDLWADLWAAVTANQLNPPERPAVDFSEEAVVVLLLGERRTGGYSIAIEQIIDRRESVEVVVEVTRPEPGAMVTQALTSPFYIAAVPVADKKIAFSGDNPEDGFEGD